MTTPNPSAPATEPSGGKEDDKPDGTGDGKGASTTATSTDSKSKIVVDPEDTSALKKALNEERKARETAEKTLKEQELAKLPELERLKTEHAEITQDRDAWKRKAMQLEIGLEYELPVKFHKRISGTTEEEMRKDAADIAADFKLTEKEADEEKRTPPPPNDGRKAANGSGPSGKMTPSDYMKAAIKARR